MYQMFAGKETAAGIELAFVAKVKVIPGVYLFTGRNLISYRLR